MAQPITIRVNGDASAVLELLRVDSESFDDAATRLITSSLTDHCRRIEPAAFERLVGRALERRGYSVIVTGGKDDQGIDLLAIRNAERLAVQCKRYDNGSLIVPSHIREFLGAVVASRATRGVFVTTSAYTSSAREFAATQLIELVSAENLSSWLSTEGEQTGVQPPWRQTGVRPPKREITVQRCVNCGESSRGVGEWTVAWGCGECNAYNRSR